MARPRGTGASHDRKPYRAMRCQLMERSAVHGAAMLVPVTASTTRMSPEPSPGTSRIDVPSGDQSQLVRPFVNVRPTSWASPVATSTMPIGLKSSPGSAPWRIQYWKAILVPSGDQRGLFWSARVGGERRQGMQARSVGVEQVRPRLVRCLRRLEEDHDLRSVGGPLGGSHADVRDRRGRRGEQRPKARAIRLDRHERAASRRCNEQDLVPDRRPEDRGRLEVATCLGRCRPVRDRAGRTGRSGHWTEPCRRAAAGPQRRRRRSDRRARTRRDIAG